MYVSLRLKVKLKLPFLIGYTSPALEQRVVYSTEFTRSSSSPFPIKGVHFWVTGLSLQS